MHVSASGQKKTSYLLELELQVVLTSYSSCLTRVLGTTQVLCESSEFS